LFFGFRDQFWKYAVTSSHGGRHLNVWECETWQCLSRLRFETPDDDGTPLTLTVDPSNRFLFVSDIDRAVSWSFFFNYSSSLKFI
jgi:hypothetical protein